MPSLLRRIIPLLIPVVSATACGGTDSPAGPAPTPLGISITVTNPDPVPVLAVPVGAQVSIALTRSGGFTGAVTVSAEGLPTGWTASFAPAQITSGSGTLATVTVPASPTRGNYVVAFRASATGVSDATGLATIRVQ